MIDLWAAGGLSAVLAFSFWLARIKVFALILVVSQANIGGPPTALALADSFGRKDLRIPGVAVGSIGYAVGTYLGVVMAATVSWLSI